MVRRYYTRASKLGGLAEIAAERGAALTRSMRELGLDPAALRSPEMAIDYGAFCELLRRCATAWDLPDLGLRMARLQQIDVLGPVALVTRMERTVRGAWRRSRRTSSSIPTPSSRCSRSWTAAIPRR